MGSLRYEDFILYDTLPGVPELSAPAPANGYDDTAIQSNVTTAAYRSGTKHQRFQDSTVGAGGTKVANRGYYTMVYAQYTCYSSGTGLGSICAGQPVILACGSSRHLGNLMLTNDTTGGATATAGVAYAPTAIVCTSMDNSCYGWFWCGGVAPNYDVTGLNDATGALTDGNIVANSVLQCSGGDSSVATFSVLDTTDVADYGALPVGYAYADDT